MLIEERLKAASAHLAAGREDDAALLYESVLDAAPANRTALKELASIKLNGGDVKAAMRLASAAATQAEADPEALALLARAALAAQKPEIATAALEQALEIDPHRPQACILQADLHLRRGEHAAAEALLQAAIARNPSNPDLLAALGGFYSTGGVHAPALELVQQALARQPDRPELIALLGAALARLGDHEKALAQFERAHLLQPGNPLVMAQLADAQCALGQLTEAHRSAKRCIALFQGFLPAWVSYVRIMTLRGQAKPALAEFMPVARRHPDKVGALLALTMCRRIAGEPEEALRLVEPLLPRLATLEPAERAQAVTLARDCLLSLGRFDEIAGTFPDFDLRAVLGLPVRKGEATDTSGRADADDDYDAGVVEALRKADIVVDGGLSTLEALVLLRFDLKRAMPGARTSVHGLPQLREIAELVDHVDLSAEGPLEADGSAKPGNALLPLSMTLALPPALRGEIGASIPYISAHEERRDLWRRSLADLPRPLVALAWDATRPGLLLEDFRSVFGGFDGTLVAVMWDGSRHQLAGWPGIIDGGVHFRSLADLAAVLAETDAVIGPDGIPLHVAGAMGRPGMLLSMPNPAWYWHHDAGRSSWYPTVTVLQAAGFGNWAELLPPLAPAISAFLDGISRPPAPSAGGKKNRARAATPQEAG